MIVLTSAFYSSAQTAIPADETYTRKKVTGAIADFEKIVTPQGVQEQLLIPIGGTKQWISVRGRNRSNPILLVIHGGPASPEMPISWAYEQGWEDYFTVVQWDQRGSGKSYNANDPAAIKPTLSLDQIVTDAGEVVQFLREHFRKNKVFVLGHSWGSEVGLSLAKRHPEMLYAYIGMGQIISGVENERIGYANTLKAARAASNVEAIKQLEAIAPYPNPDGTVPLEKIDVERNWSVFYGGLTAGRSSFHYYGNAEDLSPEYSEADLEAVNKGSALSLKALLPDMIAFDFTHVTSFQTPIVIFAGRRDNTTPPDNVAEWLTHVHAPAKKIVWFENSAHMMSVEEPGRVLVHLVTDVRPLAGKDLQPYR